MINKNVYLETKRWIKTLCKTNLKNLCKDMELSKYETDLTMGYYDGKTLVEQCMDLNISSWKYTNDLKAICTKIHDYKSTL